MSTQTIDLSGTSQMMRQQDRYRGGTDSNDRRWTEIHGVMTNG